MIDQKALEAVAAIEHDQWAHWTRYMLDNLTPENARRWDWQCVTPYNELSETEKDSDRKWAVKSITAYEAAKPQPDQEALDRDTIKMLSKDVISLSSAVGWCIGHMEVAGLDTQYAKNILDDLYMTRGDA